jgi:C4-dicarboxylate-specific signal transduction histidine kinase
VLSFVGLNQVERAAYYHAAPVEELTVLVNLERDAAITQYLSKFARRSRSAVNPPVLKHVVDRQDAYAIVQ